MLAAEVPAKTETAAALGTVFTAAQPPDARGQGSGFFWEEVMGRQRRGEPLSVTSSLSTHLVEFKAVLQAC